MFEPTIHEDKIILDPNSNVENEINNITNLYNVTEHAILKTLVGPDEVHHFLFKPKTQKKCLLLNLNMKGQNNAIVTLVQNFIRMCLNQDHPGEFFRIG